MAHELFYLPELMSQVLSFASIRSMVTLGGTCKLGRYYMQDALNTLIQAILIPYFPLLGKAFSVVDCYDTRSPPCTVDRKSFMAVLESSSAVVTGSSTLKVILPCERRSSIAPNLNIVVPLGRMESMESFIGDAGYRGRRLTIDDPLHITVRSCIHYIHPTTNRIIILAESARSTVLGVVVEGKNTSTMNMITSRSIYALYQGFTATGNALCGASYSTLLDISNAAALWGIDVQCPIEQLDDHGRICGLECPRRFRKMLGGYGVGQVCWNPLGRDTWMQGNERMRWRLGDYCPNPGCQDKEPELYRG